MKILNDDMYEQELHIEVLMSLAEAFYDEEDEEGAGERNGILADIRETIVKHEAAINNTYYSTLACRDVMKVYCRTPKEKEDFYQPLLRRINSDEPFDVAAYKQELIDIYYRNHAKHMERLKNEEPPTTKYTERFDSKYPWIGADKENEDGVKVVGASGARLDPWTKKPLETPAKMRRCGHYCDYDTAVTMFKCAAISKRGNSFVCPSVGCDNMIRLDDVIKV